MSLQVGCPRCAAPVAAHDAGWSCPEHGGVAPLWRPDGASYDAFVDHLALTADVPTWLPWPMSPGWTVTDFAAVGEPAGRAVATMTCVSGHSDPDGPVDVLVVSEEPGTGLGARIAGAPGSAPGDPGDAGDPGVDISGPPVARVRLEHQPVPLWPVPTSATSATTGEWDRSVVAGEALGRWLWIVLRPASAVLLLRDEWLLRDVSGLGPALVEVPFGATPPPW